LIEIETFRLAEGADDAAFREANARAQTDVAYQQPGMLRRTVARSVDGEWLVYTLWGSAELADAAASALDELQPFIDATTLRVTRYDDLGG
jgi:heme-degrading monooxygenase HmoA